MPPIFILFQTSFKILPTDARLTAHLLGKTVRVFPFGLRLAGCYSRGFTPAWLSPSHARFRRTSALLIPAQTPLCTCFIYACKGAELSAPLWLFIIFYSTSCNASYPSSPVLTFTTFSTCRRRCDPCKEPVLPSRLPTLPVPCLQLCQPVPWEGGLFQPEYLCNTPAYPSADRSP